MRVLVSKCRPTDMQFSKDLFTEIADNLKIMSDEELESSRESYKRVTFAVYIRTDVDNLVMMTDNTNFAEVGEIPYFLISSISRAYPTLLIDAGIVQGKSLLEKSVRTDSKEAFKRLVYNSTCYPVGAVETENSYVVVFNIVLFSDLLKDTEIHLNEGFNFCPIESLKDIKDSTQKEILKSLVLVKARVNYE